MAEQFAQPDFTLNAHPAKRTGSWEVKLAILGAVLLLLLTTQSLQVLFADTSVEGAAKRMTARDNPVYLGMFAICAGVFGLLTIRHLLTQGPSSRLAAGLCIGMLVGGSTLWSVDQRFTMTFAAVFIILLTAGYAMAAYLRPRVFLQVYFWVTTAILMVSFGLLIVAPELAGEIRHGGGWLSDRQFRGMISTKNLAGCIFASTALLAVHGRAFGVSSMWIRVPVATLALLAVLLANSATSLVAVVLLLPLSLAIAWMPRFGAQLAFAAVCVFLVLAFTIPFIDVGELFQLIGRDATFTGRAQLWELAVGTILERPLLGYGYWGFFSADPYSPAWAFWENFKYFITDTFHNSAIDVTVSLGFLGLGVLCATIFFAAQVVFNETEQLSARLLVAWLLAIYVIASAMDFLIFHHNNVATVVTFYAFFAAGQRYPQDEV